MKKTYLIDLIGFEINHVEMTLTTKEKELIEYLSILTKENNKGKGIDVPVLIIAEKPPMR